MSFPRYPKYKDSGVRRLGQLPEHWGLTRLRHVCQCLDGQRVPLNSSERAERQGEIPYWGANSIVDYVDTALFDEDIVLLGEDGAPFFERTRPVAFFSQGKIWPNNHVHVLRPVFAGTGRFITHALNSTDYAQFIDGATRDKLTQGSMNAIPIPWPPGQEQAAIASFLDQETARIDELVAEQVRLIELLKEKRQAVISHAVTKGLNPGAPMKPPGVDWLGEVPAHWECHRNKAVFAEVDVRSTSSEGELLTVSHITGVTPRSEKLVNMILAETLEGYKTCEPGDLVINTMWAWMGALGCARVEGLVSPSYNVYRPRDASRLAPDYYDLLCRVPAHIVAMKSRSSGVWESRLRLYPDAFLDMRMPLPPIDEQNAIVNYVRAITEKWDRLVLAAQYSIDLLLERRSGLISAAVTGQIDVRHLAQEAAA